MTEGKRRVLIAEDEALIRLDLREMLLEEGYEVCGEAGDGEMAVKLAEELRPDLCIFDIKMPIMDGLALIELVRKGAVRRAKLYYLRDRRGKSARIAERTTGRGMNAKAAAE